MTQMSQKLRSHKLTPSTSVSLEIILSTINLILVALPQIVAATTTTNDKRLNVLLILSDDMRPDIAAYLNVTSDLGQYGGNKRGPKMYTPNLDRLASTGVLLNRAYVQQAVCGPSRTSLLTSRRPDTTRVHDLVLYWRTVAGNFTTLPQHFKENGYRTAGFGKVFHQGSSSGGHHDPLSWTETYFYPSEKYWNARVRRSWFAAEEAEIGEHPLPDDQTTDRAVQMLENIVKPVSSDNVTGQPFFLAVGLLKPHLPFVFPKRFLAHYPSSSVSLPDNPYAPDEMPEIAWSDYDEMRKYLDIHLRYGHGAFNTTSYPDRFVVKLRRAYYASISYVDEMVGRLLDAVDRLGLGNDTIVSFVGDHGYQLGEHGEWCKHTNFELAVRAPVIIRVPGVTNRPSERSEPHGRSINELVEFVDIFPTISEAAGLPIPGVCPENSSLVRLCTEGASFFPLLRPKPAKEDLLATKFQWKNASFSQYPRMIMSGNVVMGYSVRTNLYRYTEWVLYDTFKYAPIWFKGFRKFEGASRGIELYDHGRDPDENWNVAFHDEYKIVRRQMRKVLRAGWRAAAPANTRATVTTTTTQLSHDDLS